MDSAFGAEGSEDSEGGGGALTGASIKRDAPDGAGWGRLTAAGCVEGLCSLTLKGKVSPSSMSIK